MRRPPPAARRAPCAARPQGVERKALQFIFDCLDEPELLDDAQALQEYPMRRAAVEAASRRAWERALQPRR